MGIIGENINTNLIQQIDIRQQRLGKSVLDPQDIIYNNSNTSWLRVASSVDVYDDELAGLGDFTAVGAGNRFAKNAVLFGPAGNDENPLGRLGAFGFAQGNRLDRSNEYNYGWGANVDKWGYTPPPGVQNLSITALNRGAIRKANISLVAYNPDQFRIIEALYLRLGFTILVEWGHTMYYNNDNELQQRSNFITPPFDTFMEGGVDCFKTVTQQLITERNQSSYNYDGFIGYISNFNWGFSNDGSYRITLDVITRGGLIDSLKTNHVVDSSKIPKVEGSDSPTKNATILVAYLENWKRQLKSGTAVAVGPFSYNPQTRYDDGEATPNVSAEEKYGLALLRDGELMRYEVATQSDRSQHTSLFFISLGCFLRFIKEQGLFYDDNGEPIVNIDTDYRKTFMLAHPFQNSVNPRVCLLQSKSPYIEGLTAYDQFPLLLVEAEVMNFRTDNPFKGDMMGIMINMDYIISQVEATKDDGSVPLGPLLQNILNGVSKTTGAINNFSVSYNEELNSIELRDNTAIPGVTPENKKVGKIHIYGMTKDKENPIPGEDPIVGLGSFVENLSFSSKIFPKIQNAVAIAAQNPDVTAGEQVSSFQRLNKGLKDRVSKGAKPFNKTNEKTPYEFYKNEIFKIKKHFAQNYNGYLLQPEEVMADFETALGDILSYDLQYRATKGEITSPFFIPVELSLTMKGISGFKLYEKFDIGPDYILPPSYPNNVNFIIQGINHDVRDNKWTTTLNTLSWPSSAGVEIQDIRGIISGDRESQNEPSEQNENASSSQTQIAENPSRPAELWWGDAYSTRDNFGITPFNPTTPEEVGQTVNKKIKPYVVDFLNRCLATPGLQGLKISINSTTRTVAQQEKVSETSAGVAASPGSSPHNFGMALDITLYDLTTNKLLRNNLSSKEQWAETGIVDAASDAQLSSWGANFDKYDPLHFGMKFDKPKSQNIKKTKSQQLGKGVGLLTGREIIDIDFPITPGKNFYT